MLENPLGTLDWVRATYGDAALLDFRVEKGTLFARPEAAEHILLTHAKNFSKQTRGYNVLRGLLGDGLLTSEGDFWLRQRRIASPAFHRDRIASFASTMVRSTDDLIDSWIRQPGVVEFDRDMMTLTMRIAGLTLLSHDTLHEGRALSEALGEVLENQVLDRILNPLRLPLFVPTPMNRRFHASRGVFDALIYRTIADRRGGKSADDLLDMLLNATDAETGERMSDTQLRDELLTMFLAGHETTASSLAFTTGLLVTHPEVLERAVAEVDEVLGDRVPDVQSVKQVPFLNAVIEEAMRIFPPVPFIARRAKENDTVTGFRVQKGDLVFVAPWLTHRHPDLWPDPLAFKPERFLPGGHAHEALPARFAMYPFLFGPRKCIGESFARLEQTLVMARLLQRLDLQAVAATKLIPHMGVTLRVTDGLKLSVANRV